VNGGSLRNQTAETTVRQRLWTFGILFSALIATGVTGYCLFSGISIICPHLFYVPIVMAAYWYPRHGVGLAGLLAAIYIGEVLVFVPAGGAELAGALIRAGIFLAVAAVVSYLSDRLQSRESRYRGIFDTSEAGIFLFQPDTLAITEMNRRSAEILGFPSENTASLMVPAIWPDYAATDGIRDRLAAGAGITNLDCEFVRGDGTTCPVLLSANLLPDQGVICTVITETTEQKRMADRLRRSEEMVRAILDAVEIGIIVTNPGETIVDANEAAVRMYGSTDREDLLGKKPYTLVAERDRTLAQRFWEQVVQEGQAPPTECTLRRKDGTEWTAEISATLLKGQHDVLERLILVFRDVTEQHRKAEEMRIRNKRLSITSEIVGAATASQRLDDRLRISLTKILDALDLDLGAIYLMHPGTDAVELRCQRGIGEEPCLPALSALWQDEPLFRDVLLDGQPRYVNNFPEHFPERTDLDIRSFAAAPILGDIGPVGCIAVASRVRDTTSEEERAILTTIGEEIGNTVVQGILQEELERALAAAHRYLGEADAATEEANLYIDILAHDINNANTAAMGYQQMVIASADGSLKKIALKSLTAIQQSGEIIRNVTTLRRLRHEATVLRPVKLDSTIRDMLNYFSDARIAYEGTDAVVMADDLIREIFANLIGNAVKFGGPEVDITISPRIEENGEVVITVADTGPGIPDELKPHIFQRSRTGNTKKSGKGLGLFIVRMLVERYGGRVWAADRVPGHPEQGAAITFTARQHRPDTR
jgi:PAS domain S-box-containing protein